MKTSELIDKVSQAFTKAQAEFKSAKKSAKNPFLKNSYSNLEDVHDAVKGALTSNDLGVIQSSELRDGDVFVTTTRLVHSSGQYFESESPLYVTKKDPQSIGSLVSYGRRYGLVQMLNISTGEDDDGATATGNTAKSSAVAAARAIKASKGDADDIGF